MQNKEVWKPIKGYEGLYEVSNLGRVKSLSKKRCGNGKPGILKERILKATPNSDGYYHVKLFKDGNKKTFKVHRLVVRTFIGNSNGKDCINHINGIKTDNSINNLEWCTFSENINHAYENGLNPWKIDVDKAKLKRCYLNNMSTKEMSLVFNCSAKTIRNYIKKYNLKES